MDNFIKQVKQVKKNGITNDILDILINSYSLYFNTKGLRYELYRKHGIILRGRPPLGMNVYNDQHLKLAISTKIGHVLRKLKKLGFIEKVSNSAWKKIKEIDPTLNELYTFKEREKLK